MGSENQLHEFLRQAQEITAQMQAASEQMTQREVVGAADNGAVQVTMTSQGEVRAVHIAPRAVDPNDLPALERHVAAAMQQALDNVRGVAEQLIRPYTDELTRLSDG